MDNRALRTIFLATSSAVLLFVLVGLAAFQRNHAAMGRYQAVARMDQVYLRPGPPDMPPPTAADEAEAEANSNRRVPLSPQARQEIKDWQAAQADAGPPPEDALRFAAFVRRQGILFRSESPKILGEPDKVTEEDTPLGTTSVLYYRKTGGIVCVRFNAEGLKEGVDVY